MAKAAKKEVMTRADFNRLEHKLNRLLEMLGLLLRVHLDVDEIKMYIEDQYHYIRHLASTNQLKEL